MSEISNALDSLIATAKALENTVLCKLQSLAINKRRFVEAQEDVETINTSQADCEYVDVGGTRFHVRSAVLRGRGDHFFSLWLSGAFVSERERDGSLFIDRDPEHFALVLQYLRQGTAHAPRAWAGLQREANFYGLSDLSRAVGVRPYLTTLPRGPGPVHVYDVQSDVWRPVPSLASPPGGNALSLACWSGHTMAVVYRPDGLYLDMLNPISLAWETLAPIPANLLVQLVQLVGAGPQLFCSLPGDGLVMLYGRNRSGRHWEHLPRMASMRVDFGVCALGCDLVAVGGRNGGSWALCTVEKFSCSDWRWESLPDMKRERCYPGVGMWRGKVIVAGGLNPQLNTLRSVEAFDLDTGHWQEMASLVSSHIRPTVVVFAENLMVIGIKSNGSLSVEQYDCGAQLWRVVSHAQDVDCAAVVPLPRHGR